MVKWERILKPQHILIGLNSRRNFEAIRELAAVFDSDGVNIKALVANIIKRERDSSTGIGKGVAVPHAHQDDIPHQLLAIGISHDGIDFSSIDDEPVKIIALLATPVKHQKQHMELLAALSRTLQQETLRSDLTSAVDSSEVIEVFLSSNKTK
jgi:PTS system fructose-specific IIA component/PTS system nitrogen regulatory IIA component